MVLQTFSPMQPLRIAAGSLHRRILLAAVVVLGALILGFWLTPAYAATVPQASLFAAAKPAPPCKDLNCIADRYIDPAIEVMVALVGVIVVIGIITAGIQYSSSGSDPAKITAAKQRIYKSLTALIALFTLWAFLTWLLPGGLGF